MLSKKRDANVYVVVRVFFQCKQPGEYLKDNFKRVPMLPYLIDVHPMEFFLLK